MTTAGFAESPAGPGATPDSPLAGAGVTDLRTCTVRFEGPGSEHEYAKLVASTFGTAHQEIVVEASHLAADLPHILEHLDQPTLDAVNAYYVSRAASSAGIKAVLIPEDNRLALSEIPARIKEGLNIIPVEKMDEVLKRALTRYPDAITWDEEAEEAAARAARKVDETGEGMTAH